MSTLAKGKKRYNLSLTQNRVEYIQGILKKGGVPSSHLSLMVDDFLAGIEEVFREYEEKGGKMTYGNVLDAVVRSVTER